MTIKKKHYVFFIIIIIFGLLVDQITKRIAHIYLKPISTFPIIENVFHFTYRENTGAAFSILEGARWFLLIIPILLVILLSFIIFTGRIRSVAASYSLVFVITGGLGNFIDRAVNGYVVDMLDFNLINFAVFNVADIFVTCGSIVFVILYLISNGELIKWKLE